MSTFENVKEIIIDTLNFDAEEVTAESDFFEDLNADSLDIVELMMVLEEKTGVTIPDEELQNLRTVQSVVDYIDAHKAA